MKTSVLLFLTDILPEKRRLFNKLVKNKIFGNLPTDKVFSQMKKSGINGVEVLLPDFATENDIKDLKVVLDKNKMEAYSIHQALRFLTKTRIAEIQSLFETASFLSAKVIVLHMNSAGKQLYDKKYIDEIHRLQKKYDIKVGFENSEKHAGSVRNKIAWHELDFANLIQKNDFNITLDICHLGQTGGNIIKFIEKNIDRIINVHFSDYKSHYLNNSLRPMRYKHLPLGKGELPIVEIIQALKKEGYKGTLTLEIETNLQGLQASAEIIKNAS